MIKFVFDVVENILGKQCGKGEKAGDLHFLLLPQHLQKHLQMIILILFE